jgi:hypothetical protein
LSTQNTSLIYLESNLMDVKITKINEDTGDFEEVTLTFNQEQVEYFVKFAVTRMVIDGTFSLMQHVKEYSGPDLGDIPEDAFFKD